jgi:O-antigen/teichoic acid export membrane protein/SAM-dependent methyltransferase
MIIELLGTSGAGKAIFARELCQRLGASGLTADLIQSERPDELDPEAVRAGTGGIVARMTTVPLSILRWLAPGRELDLLALLPPAHADRITGLRQHIDRLSRSWTSAAQSDCITIFEQGFAQTVGLLAMHSRTGSDAAIEAALELVPKADLVIRVDAPAESSDAHTDEGTPRPILDLAEAGIFDHVSDLLREHGTPLICLRLEGDTLEHALHSAEEEIKARRAAVSAATNPGATVPRQQPAASPGEALLQPIGPAAIRAMLPYLIGALLAFMVEFLAARVIGPHSYGIYAFAFAWASVVAYGSTLGFNVSLQRLVPAYLARQENDLARGVIQYAGRRTLATAMAAAVVGATFITMYPAHLRQEVIATCLMGLAAAPLITLLLVDGSVTRSFGGTLSALAIERVVLNGLVLGLIFLTAWYHLWPRDATLAMGSILVGAAISAMVLAPALREVRPRAVRMAGANYALSEWRSSIAPLTIIVGAEIILNRAGIIVLGFEGSIDKAGIFGIALSMAMLTTRPLAAVGKLIEPLASHSFLRHDRFRLQALLSTSTRFSLITAILIAISLLLLADPLLDWLGEDFESGTNAFRILLIGQLVAAAFGPQQQLMTMAGRERTAAATLIVGATVNVFATIAANRLWGMTGAAAATAASLIAWNLTLAILMRSRQQIGPGLAGWAAAAAPAAMPWSGWQGQNGAVNDRRRQIAPPFGSYREGSTGAGYGRRYVKTFAEGFYAMQWRQIEGPLLRNIFARLAARGATRSLDFACGTGRILELHEEAFDDIIGVDISPEMLAFARSRYPGIRFVEADLTKTGAIAAVSNRQVCTAFRFFLNAEPSLRAEVLDVLRNCLVEGGTLVVNFHGNPASLVGLVYPIRNRLAGQTINKLMNPGEAIALLEAHGFEAKELHWYGVWPPIFRRTQWLNALCMARAEALGRRFPILMRRCQTFVIVARRR